MKAFCTLLFMLALAIPSELLADVKLVRLTRYEGRTITAVSASSAFEVTLVKSNQTKAVVEVNEELESRLKFSLSSDGVLSVGINTEGFRWNNANRQVMRMTVYLPEIRSLKGSGAVRITSEDQFTTENMKINLSGATSLKSFSIKAGTVDLDCTGASNGTLRLEAGSIDASASGASNLKLTVATGYAEISASGASDITATGSSGEVKLEASGASTVRAVGLEAKKANARSSSASTVSVWATEELNANASGASSVKYKGNPVTFKSQSSGASSVKKTE